MNIYAGNLSFDVTDEDSKQAFSAFGKVASARIIKDNYSGKSKGFGLVEMPNNAEAQFAIDGLNDKEFNGRRLKVNTARPRNEKHGNSRKCGHRGRDERHGRGRRF